MNPPFYHENFEIDYDNDMDYRHNQESILNRFCDQIKAHEPDLDEKERTVKAVNRFLEIREIESIMKKLDDAIISGRGLPMERLILRESSKVSRKTFMKNMAKSEKTNLRKYCLHKVTDQRWSELCKMQKKQRREAGETEIKRFTFNA